MKKALKFIGIALAILFIVGIIGFFYLKNMEDVNLQKETAVHSIDAIKFFNTYEKNEEKSNTKYMDQIVDISGKVSEISVDRNEAKVIYMRADDAMFGVMCTFKKNQTEKLDKYKVGDPITVRGICVGKTLDVVLNKSEVIE